MKKQTSWFRCSFVLALILTFAAGVFVADSADARRRRKRRRTKQPKVINEKKLFERLGGRTVLESSTEEWFKAVVPNPVLDGAPAIEPTSLVGRFKPLAERTSEFARMRKQLVEELCEISDGPCPEKEDSAWLQLRASAGLDEGAMIEFTAIFSDVLQQKGVGERERNELIGRLGSIEPLSSADAAGPASERRGGNR